VDAETEINKLEKKAELVQSSKEKLHKTMTLPNYETNVKQEVRQGNTERVSSAMSFRKIQTDRG
jgi:valyl-tRNA synthetase